MYAHDQGPECEYEGFDEPIYVKNSVDKMVPVIVSRVEGEMGFRNRQIAAGKTEEEIVYPGQRRR